jgi:oligosaccharide reducing-end xylanase
MAVGPGQRRACAGQKLNTKARFHLKIVSLFCFGVLLTGLGAANATGPDGNGAYATGSYRNLFAESGHTQAEIQHKIDGAFQQLFHGNPTNEAVYYPAGSNSNGTLAFITDIKHHDVRSEGLSYGMMIAVQLNKKPEFDALWNWSKTYLYVAETNHPSYGFFAWQARTNGARMSQFVAPDGLERYYEGLLYMMALLHCGGEFRVW